MLVYSFSQKKNLLVPNQGYFIITQGLHSPDSLNHLIIVVPVDEHPRWIDPQLHHIINFFILTANIDSFFDHSDVITVAIELILMNIGGIDPGNKVEIIDANNVKISFIMVLLEGNRWDPLLHKIGDPIHYLNFSIANLANQDLLVGTHPKLPFVLIINSTTTHRYSIGAEILHQHQLAFALLFDIQICWLIIENIQVSVYLQQLDIGWELLIADHWDWTIHLDFIP